MFGFFKKPDAVKGAKESLVFWLTLSDRDKKTVAENIEKFVAAISIETSNGAGAISRLGEYKQAVIRQHNISTAQHPAFIQVQIISDYIFSYSQGAAEHAQCASIFKEMISPLSPESQQKILSQLGRDTGNPAGASALQGEQPFYAVPPSAPKTPVVSVPPVLKSKATPAKVVKTAPAPPPPVHPTFSSSTVTDLYVIATAGDSDAQYKLGVMYERGDGVEDNCVAAARWYKLSAEQGHATAQFNLALLYKSGIGVTQDLDMAKRLMTQAANARVSGAVNALDTINKLIAKYEVEKIAKAAAGLT
jgi:hypothetical protein